MHVEDIILVPLKRTNQFTIMDYADRGILCGKSWWINNWGYAVTGRGKLLHRLISRTPTGMETDHINGNRLDNRRSNLRTATRAENACNLATPRSSTSGYKGVHIDRGKWRALIQISGHKKHLGYFKNKEEAARAYDTAARKYFGEFARTNFHD